MIEKFKGFSGDIIKLLIVLVIQKYKFMVGEINDLIYEPLRGEWSAWTRVTI